MKSYKGVAIGLILGLASILLYQNCSNARFTVEAPSTSSDAPQSTVGTPDTVDPKTPGLPKDPELGLKGGHFDLDTSSAVYAFNAGKTDHHVHEYDDKHNVIQVDFFNLIDSKFTKITDRVAANQEFYIIVANAALSPGAILEINGNSISALDYQKKVDLYLAGNSAALQKFSLSSLQNFKLKFSNPDLGQGILVPTQTSCVVSNKPSVRNEYRNGAFVVQILDAQQIALSPSTRTALASGGLLWEATAFWHKEGTPCQ